MAIKTNSKGSWGLPAGRDASAIMLDGYLRLGAAVVIRAIKDYQGDDILKMVDALAWFLTDDPAVWLQMLELGGDDPDEVFLSLVRGEYAERNQFTRAFS